MKRVTPLNVGGAFHTPLMRDAADALAAELAAVDVRRARGARRVEPRRARPTPTPTAGATGSAEHVAVPVRWRSSMETLVGLGATTFLEVGHGSMLAALAKRTVPDVTVRSVATPDDVPTLAGGR